MRGNRQGDHAGDAAHSHENRFEQLSKRIRTAYKANQGLVLSPSEIQLLGMTSLVSWQPDDDCDL